MDELFDMLWTANCLHVIVVKCLKLIQANENTNVMHARHYCSVLFIRFHVVKPVRYNKC